MSKEAISGLKVVEFSEFISGPYCGKHLADFGAEVIKVEKPGLGDKARNWGPFPEDIPHPEKSGLFLFLNTNKLGVTLNLETATGVKIFKDLAKWADVLIEDCPPKEAEQLDIDYEKLHPINPRLVVTSITPFGQTGPYRDYKTCDLVSLHASGEAYINPPEGVDDINQQAPLKVPAHGGDFMTGLTAALCTMSAVITQQKTGVGQHVDLSRQEALASITRHDIGLFTYEDVNFSRVKSSETARFMTYPCKNGYIIISSMERDAFWAGAKEMMGNPEWAESELCKDQFTRRANWDMIALMISEWTKEHTTEEVEKAAVEKRFPCSTVHTMKEVFALEQLAAREYFVDVDHKEAGKFTYPGAPFKLSGTPWSIRHPAPLLGEYNEQIYCGRLGYSRQDLVKMRQAGII